MFNYERLVCILCILYVYSSLLNDNRLARFIILCNPKLGLGFLIPSIFIIQSPVPKGLKEEMKLNLTRSDILQGHARFKS